MKVILLAGIFALLLSCKSDLKKEAEKPYQLKIAYNVLYDDESDNYEVFIMDLDGTNKKNITNLAGVEWAYYSYKDDIYFISDKDTIHRLYYLYKMKPDGSAKTKMTDIRLADSWHSSRNNGSELIITPHKSVDSAFYIIDNTGKKINVLRPNLKYFSDPSFSPDGSQVAFRGAHFLTKRDSSFVDEIYIMNTDGSNLRQLTTYPNTDTTAVWYAYKAGPPKWHPTENFISYASFQNGKYSLYGAALNEEKQWKLTDNLHGEVYHDWSPDGNWLVTDLSNENGDQYHIGLVNWQTKETRILTDTSYKFQQAPVFVKVYD